MMPMRTSPADSTDGLDLDPRPEAIPARWIFSLTLLGSVVLSAGISAQTYLSMLGHGHSFAGILAWQLSCWSVWAIVAPIVVRHAGSLVSEGRDRRRAWIRLGLLGTVFVAAHVALAAQFALWFQPYVPVVATGYQQAFVRQLSVLPVDLLAYATLLLIGWALAVFRVARRLEIRESRLEAELAKAQLEALRLEIQPHFLFNTLNAISALIRLKANDRALDMLVGLSELMRHTLGRTKEQLTTLDAEIDFTKRYVDLQQARFADRLDVAYQIEESCRELAVPTFVLQPLVENAIRHGMGRQNQRCRLEVGARLEPDGLHLWVSDDGVGLAPGFNVERDAHTGLGNTLLPARAALRSRRAPRRCGQVRRRHGGRHRGARASDCASRGHRMSRFRVLVADDEPLARGIVTNLLRDDPEIESVVECGDATEVRRTIERLQADIVFLDVEMPEIDGIQIASGLSAEDPVIVFVTAFSDYATSAFEVRAVDYVLKPFSDARFREALARAKERVRERRAREVTSSRSPDSASTPVDAVLGADSTTGYLQRLTFRDADRLVVLKTADVLWIEAQDYYVLVHSRRGRHMVRATLATLETRLDPRQFLRVHRAAIVNVDEVQDIRDKNGMRLTLSNGAEIPVSRYSTPADRVGAEPASARGQILNLARPPSPPKWAASLFCGQG